MPSSSTPRQSRPNSAFSRSPSTPSSNVASSFKPPSPPVALAAVLSPEDLRDKSLMAIYAAFASVNNQALCVKELVDVCRSKRLHALGGATPSGTLNSAIRNHINRCTERSKPCLLSRHVLSGEASDALLAPAIGAKLHNQNVLAGEEKTYLRNKNGRTRKGVCLWFLSEWTGYQNPFVREGFVDIVIQTEGGPPPSPSPVSTQDSAVELSTRTSFELDLESEEESEEEMEDPASSQQSPSPSISHPVVEPVPSVPSLHVSTDFITSPASATSRSNHLASPTISSQSDMEQDSSTGTMEWSSIGFDRLDLQNFTWSGEPDDDAETILSTPRSVSLGPDSFGEDGQLWQNIPRINDATIESPVNSAGETITAGAEGYEWKKSIPTSSSHSPIGLRLRQGKALDPYGNELLLTIPMSTSYPRMDSSGYRVDYPSQELESPFTPIGSPFSSSASSERSIDLDHDLAFSPESAQEEWQDEIPRAVQAAPLDLDAQNGNDRRQHEEDMQDLLAGPEGTLLHELEEAWGERSPDVSLLAPTRYTPGMCVPMHNPAANPGRIRSLSFDRSTRGTKRSEPDLTDDHNEPYLNTHSLPGGVTRTNRIVSLPNVSFESFLVSGTAPSPAPSSLPLKDDNFSSTGITSSVGHFLESHLIVNTSEPVHPAIYATLVESLPVFATSDSGGPRLLRRMDSDFVNVTTLSAISNPSISAEEIERITALFSDRQINPSPSSSSSSTGGLSGIWIALSDVQQLCADGVLDIPDCLRDHFLRDDLADLFPEPIPEISRVHRHSKLLTNSPHTRGAHADQTKSDAMAGAVPVSGLSPKTNGADSETPKRRPGRPRGSGGAAAARNGAAKTIGTRSHPRRLAAGGPPPVRPSTRSGLRSGRAA